MSTIIYKGKIGLEDLFLADDCQYPSAEFSRTGQLGTTTLHKIPNVFYSGDGSFFEDDVTLADNSDKKVPTQKATKTYVDTRDLVYFYKLALVGSDTYGATIDVVWSGGTVHLITLTGNAAITFSEAGTEGCLYRILLKQDASGNRLISSWPTITWKGGAAPTLTVTGGATDIITLLYANSTYYGEASLNFS